MHDNLLFGIFPECLSASIGNLSDHWLGLFKAGLFCHGQQPIDDYIIS